MQVTRVNKKQIIAPKQILKGQAGKAAPQQKPTKKKIGVIYGTEKVTLLDLIRKAANALDLEAAYESMDIKSKGVLRAIYTAAAAQTKDFGLFPTPVLDADGKATDKEEVAVGFGEVVEKDGSVGYRTFVKTELSGNTALLWIEAFDSRFEFYSEFGSLYGYTKIKFFDGPSGADKKHVYVQFSLTDMATVEADAITQLVRLAAAPK